MGGGTREKGEAEEKCDVSSKAAGLEAGGRTITSMRIGLD